MTRNKIILSLEKTRISNTEYYIVQNVNLPKETSTKRVADGWINISQCFKLETTYSNQSKRQKIIDEEEKSGNITVEKIMGGWGRIQGSWVSPKDAIYLFKKYSFKNFVNLTILTFKEKEEEPLPVKQDVKNYQSIQFEFDAVEDSLNTSAKKENKTPKAQKAKTGNKSSQDMKNKNAYKRVSMTQMSSGNYDTTGYTMKNQHGVLSPLSNEAAIIEESPLKIRSDNESNITSESPYKKIKIENANDQFPFFDVHKSAFPVMQSSMANKQFDANTHNITTTPYNTQSGMGRYELSTFKNYNNMNFSHLESDTRNHGSVVRHTKNLSQDTYGSTSSINSPLNNKVPQPKIASAIPSAQSVKRPRMNGEKFKNLIIKALETETENDEIVTILYATKFPKNLDPNFPVDQEGNTALHWATAQGNISLVKYLVEVLKSDPFKSNLKGMNCVSKSLFFDNNYKNDSFHVILTLLSNCLIIQDDNGKLPLHYITDLCSLKVKDINVSIYYLNWILKFLAIEVDVPMKKTDGSNTVVITKQDFLKNGLNYQDREGNTPLHTLAANGNVQLYNHFISLGAIPSIPNLKNETPHMVIARVYGEMNKNMTSKLKDAVSLGSGTLNSDSSEKDVSVEKLHSKRESIISDETELQASSEIHNNDEFMAEPKPPILKLEKDEDDMDLSDFKVNSTNPFKSRSQTAGRKPTIPDLRNYSTYEMNMFQHYESTDGRIERPSSRAYSKSRSEKLAPLNITKINSANNTILKRSPDPNALFLQRNRINNQNMVGALKNFSDKINEVYGTLNKIYGVREQRMVDLEKKKRALEGKNNLMHELHSSYEFEKSKLKNSENEKEIVTNLKTIHNEWKAVIQESLIAQLTLKTATVTKQDRGNHEDERLAKIQKIGELLKLDKIKTKMFYVMDNIRNEKEENTKKLFIKFIEKMVLENGDKKE